jgi:hypothetical protein
MSGSPWFVEHKKILRKVVLIVLIITMFGPWMFDRVFVPAKFICSPPNIRLEGDFCGVPLSGFQFFRYIVGGTFLELIKGTLISRPRELLLFGLSVLPLISFLVSLLSFWRKGTRRIQTISLVVWILAILPTLTLFIFQINHQPIRLWGLWLYILMAFSAFVIELILLKGKPSNT